MKDFELNQMEIFPIDEEDYKKISILESFLFTFSDIVSYDDILKIFKENDIDITKKKIRMIIDILDYKYSSETSGLELLKMQDSVQLVAKKENTKYLKKILSPIKKKTLSTSAMETLTIIAYNQPITKSDIERIKGVKCDTTIKRLLESGFIKESGRLDKIGRPILFSTTAQFLKHLGIESLDQLPKLDEDIK